MTNIDPILKWYVCIGCITFGIYFIIFPEHASEFYKKIPFLKWKYERKYPEWMLTPKAFRVWGIIVIAIGVGIIALVI